MTKVKFLPTSISAFIITALLVLAVSTSYSQNLSVIANQKGSPAVLTTNELKSVFMGEKQRWPNGNKVLIALLKTNNPVGELVCKKVYDMKPDELNKFWLSLIFQGKVSAPTFFNSVADLQNFVAQTPGAISIVDQPLTTETIKTVTIDGKKTL